MQICACEGDEVGRVVVGRWVRGEGEEMRVSRRVGVEGEDAAEAER